MGNKKIRTININLADKGGTFSNIFSKLKGDAKDSEILKLKNLLSYEKTRLLHTCKTKQPESIYQLAKLLGRDFKAVRHDIKTLEDMGLIELVSSHKKNRERLKPVIEIDQFIITLNL